MPWDTIPSARFERLDMVTPFVPELKRLSDVRIAKDKDFDYVREDIAHYNKMQADKTVSLNEQERIKERGEAKVRQKARDKERLARPDPREKVYELTLKLAETPGLPPPVQKTNQVASASQDAGAAVVAMAEQLAGADPDEDEDAEEEKPTPVDVTLQEARHVLVDYLSLLRRGSVAARAPAGEAAAAPTRR
jgi:carboxyl-terminal processing protease